jgi:hypothetical protein
MPKQTKARLTRQVTIPNLLCVNNCLTRLKPGLRVVNQGSGRPGRPKCLPRNTKPRAVGIVVKLSLTSILRI